VDDRWILREIRDALPLMDKQTRTMGFTGGEPLLNWQEFIDILTMCRDVLPQTAVHVLSKVVNVCGNLEDMPHHYPSRTGGFWL
jgi:MoaA/NifB/PqqE/SkfB family radical SAM enzyme